MFIPELLCKFIPEITVILQYLYIDADNCITYHSNDSTITLRMDDTTGLVFTNQSEELIFQNGFPITTLVDAIQDLKQQAPESENLYCSRWEEIRAEVSHIVTIECAKLYDKLCVPTVRSHHKQTT